MWTATIKNVEQDATVGIVKVTIQYDSDDARRETVTERVSEVSSIQKIAINHVNELLRKDNVATFIQNPQLGVIPLSPTPTQDDLDLQEYNKKRFLLIQAKQDLDLGIIKQGEYDTLLADVIALKK